MTNSNLGPLQKDAVIAQHYPTENEQNCNEDDHPLAITKQVSIDDDMSEDEREIRILLVDDYPFNLIPLEILISTKFPSATVETALNGKIAVDLVESNDKAG